MKNEQLVLNHIPHAKSMARTFTSKVGFRDQDEAESIALLAMVEAAGRFTGEIDNGAHFWYYVKPRIAGALVDSVRSLYGRGARRLFVELKDNSAAYEMAEAMNARITIALAIPFLRPFEARVIKMALLFGTDNQGAAKVLGMRCTSFCWAKSEAVRTMRKALL